jgi:hypothetical protein
MALRRDALTPLIHVVVVFVFSELLLEKNKEEE